MGGTDLSREDSQDEAVLVVAAHPDDEVLGCGATMARLAACGRAVHVAILGEGMTARGQQRADTDAAALAQLRDATAKALRTLQVGEYQQFELPDNRFDSVDLLDVVKIVEALVRRWRPSTVYTHHPGDLNIDHGIVHRAVLTATRPMAGQTVRELYAFEVNSSTEWSFGQSEQTFCPNTFVDISDHLEQKIEAMSAYSTELRPWPHPRSLQAIRTAAQRWGCVVGCDAAEAFELIRAVC